MSSHSRCSTCSKPLPDFGAATCWKEAQRELLTIPSWPRGVVCETRRITEHARNLSTSRLYQYLHTLLSNIILTTKAMVSWYSKKCAPQGGRPITSSESSLGLRRDNFLHRFLLPLRIHPPHHHPTKHTAAQPCPSNPCPTSRSSTRSCVPLVSRPP